MSFDGLPAYTLRPFDAWTDAPPAFRSSPFKASMNATNRLLDFELRQIKAQDVVLQLAIRESEIRNDGRPYARAMPWHPGVILTLSARPPGAKEYIPLRYATARFERWQDNLRAIALALEALRKVARYGVGSGSEQYAGWKALPPGGGVSTGVRPRMSREDAAGYLAQWDTTDLTMRRAYRLAAAELHPDVNGGPREDWDRLQEAKEVLGL